MFLRKRSIWWTLAVIAMLLANGTWMTVRAWEESASPRIGVVEKTEKHPFEFEAVGLAPALLQKLAALEPTDAEFSKLFSITVAGNKTDTAIPPVSGKYRVDGSRLVFVPRFPPQPGLTYLAVIHGEAKIEREVLIPAPAEDKNRPPAQVRHVYPTSDELPENHLRFYLHFTQPMARTAAYQNLLLLDELEQPLEGSFLELGEELWDPSSQRFTLLLDPGRIKRGLKPREEDGPVLEEGKRYTLVIKREWRDARGQLLKADYRKPFKVGPPLSKPLSVAEWKIKAPLAGTSGLLTVEFPRPLDHALLERVLTVIDPDGNQIEGQSIVCNSERQWTFAPHAPWRAGRSQIVVDTVLEDSAGNRIGRAFEVDEEEPVTRKVVPEYVKIPFDVRLKENVAAKP